MKIKNSVKKKLLTGLLIGTTLSGVVSTNVFASSNSEGGEYASKEQSNKIINEIKQEYRSRSSRLQYKQYDDPCCWLVGLRNKMYLISGFGRCMTGRWRVENNVYYFDKTTLQAQRGWYNVTDSNGYNGRYYFDPSNYAAIKSGVYSVGNELFYFDGNGTVRKGLTHAGGNTYFGDSRAGVLVNGWYSTGGHRYLFNEYNNAAHTGWYQDGSAGRMYFNGDGSMAEGITNIGNDTYLFEHHGRGANTYVATGYYSDTRTDKRYYFEPSNDGKAAKNKWILTGNGYMHFGSDGAMAKGVQVIDGETFVFTKGRGHDCNYYRDLGWYNDPETHARYYFGGDRGQALKNGVYWVDGHNCRFDNRGAFMGYVN